MTLATNPEPGSLQGPARPDRSTVSEFPLDYGIGVFYDLRHGHGLVPSRSGADDAGGRGDFRSSAGTVIVSFASTIGATLAFLASRFLFNDLVQRRFGQHLSTVNHGIRKDGTFYLFTLRLVPAFRRLGSQVTLVEMLSAMLTREDPAVSTLVMERFKREGIDVRLKHRAKRFFRENYRQVLICERLDGTSGEVRIEFDRVLVALGRVANTKGFGLEELGIPLSKSGTVETNAFLQTIYPNIYACGDVAGPYQFTHTAAHQAWRRG